MGCRFASPVEDDLLWFTSLSLTSPVPRALITEILQVEDIIRGLDPSRVQVCTYFIFFRFSMPAMSKSLDGFYLLVFGISLFLYILFFFYRVTLWMN